MLSSPASHHFLPLRSNYSPQHPVLKHLNTCSSLTVRDQDSYLYNTTGKIMVLYTLFFKFPDRKQDDPCSKSHNNFSLPRSFQRIYPNPRPCVRFRNKLLFLWRNVSPSPNFQAREPPLISCSRLLVLYTRIRSYPPHEEVVSSNHNPRTRHAVVKGTHLTWPLL